MEIIGALSTEQCNGDLALQCAIHDTIEDTDTTFEQLKSEFSLSVASGVRALTKDTSLPKHEQMEDSLRRIKEQPLEIWMYCWQIELVICRRHQLIGSKIKLFDTEKKLLYMNI